jgi:hypothetical protein
MVAAASHIESNRVATMRALPKIPCNSSEFPVLSKSIINTSGHKELFIDVAIFRNFQF